MNTRKLAGVFACLVTFWVLTSQVPVLANPGYKPFESFERSESTDYWIQVEAGPVSSDLEGSFLLDRDKGDTEVDLTGTLDLSDDRNARARLQFQPYEGGKFRFGYYGIQYEETTQINADITVDGQTFSASDRVDSLLKLDAYEFGFTQDIVATDYVTVGAMLQFNIIDFKAKLDNATTGESVKEQGQVPIPYPGLRAEVFPIPWLGVYGEVRRMTGSSSGVDFGSTDLDGGIQLNLNPNYDIRVGYRRFNYDVSFEETEFDLTSEGPYASFAVRF